jgi:hypothetical protein
MAENFFDRLLAPRVILPILLVAVVVIVLLTPVSAPQGPAVLTTHSSDAGGARALYETADRLGWRVERRDRPFTAPLDRDAVYAVLQPPRPIPADEVHELLEAVRDGARLLLVPTRRSDLGDSLGIRTLFSSTVTVIDSIGIPGALDFASRTCDHTPLEVDPWRRSSNLATVTMEESVLTDTTTLIAVQRADKPAIAALGASLGRGRVLVVSDPDFLRNDVLRQCDEAGGVPVVRLLEWISDSAGTRVVFDEFHHGYGQQPSMMRALRRALTESSAGRTGLQLIIAALVLLVAAGARPIAPRARRQIERRSPLEHVGALSRAYEQIGATRRGAQLLVRGLRRRRDAAAWKRGSDEDFLRNIAKRHPSVAPDVERLIKATRTAATPADFIHVGEAIENIERTLTSDNA